MSDGQYTVFLILSEVLITLVAFVGAFLIFRPLFNKKNVPDNQDPEEGSANNPERE